MGTIRRLTDLQLGSIGTTKILTLSTSEVVYTLSSGNRALEVGNHNSYSVFYGQSNLAVTSGNSILSESSKFWDTVVDNFTLYFRLSSAGITGQVIIHEYQGNN